MHHYLNMNAQNINFQVLINLLFHNVTDVFNNSYHSLRKAIVQYGLIVLRKRSCSNHQA